MTLNKNNTIREIGQRTRLSNRDIQLVLETLIEVWTEELVKGGKVELEHFLVLEAQTIELDANSLVPKRHFRKLTVRASKNLRARLNETAYPI